RTSYDTVCHEHLEFYALKQIKWMLDRADLKIIELMFTETNGGSILVTAAKNGSPFAECKERTAEILDKEKAAGYGTLKPFKKFASDVEKHANDLKELLIELQKKNKKVLGYGASTKGNVVLQYAGITPQVLPGIVEVNEEKFGAYTPGSHIPILSEKDADAINPDYYLVLPWHFRESIMQRETAFLKRGGKFIFPLPSIQIVDTP
ncbi:MAG: methyltransferase, partial [Bacteroidetes bacterium]|nr:methyltransferase [Bacteroidota bacterium]